MGRYTTIEGRSIPHWICGWPG